MVERRLGRGLDFLLSGGLAEVGEGEVMHIPVTDLQPNPYQPRLEFTEQDLQELTSSIREHGVLQPVIARRTPMGYELIAGERRWRASQRAGLATIPAVLRTADDTQMLEIALVENLQRQDLNAIEVARGYAAYIERLGLTQQEAADRLGKSRSAVANTLRLLELPRDLQDLVSRGTLTAGHGRAILSLPDAEAQRRMAQRVADDGLSVREVEATTADSRTQRSRRPVDAPAHFAEIEDRLKLVLGTRVRLKAGRGERGSILIDYFSSDELTRILEILLPAERVLP